MKFGKLILVTAFLAASIMFSSCSSKFAAEKSAQEGDISLSENESTSDSVNITKSAIDLTSPSPDPISPTPPGTSLTNAASLLESELNALAPLLSPYLDEESPVFSGSDNSDYLNKYLLKPTSYMEPMAASDWEKVVRIIFLFDNTEDEMIKMYLTNFVTDGTIERQYAVAGLMKLISLRYPISLGGGSELVEQSDPVTDLKNIDDRYQMLIRQAYCMSLTDILVENEGLFRPTDPLTRGEAVSMIYSILKQFGPPNPGSENEVIETATASPNPEDSGDTSLNVESIGQEYKDYINKLKSSSSASEQEKLDRLVKAEAIINIDLKSSSVNDPLALDQWKQILMDIFNIPEDMSKPYLSYETGGILPYDVAAISIFKVCYELVDSSYPRDATQDELEQARTAIPQFDSARDISKFAQMYSTGLLRGLNEIPGFTPQRPVSKAEALILVKRLLEAIN